MDLQEFRDSVLSDQPPKNLSFALSGLWWDAKGDLGESSRICAARRGAGRCVGTRVLAP